MVRRIPCYMYTSTIGYAAQSPHGGFMGSSAAKEESKDTLTTDPMAPHTLSTPWVGDASFLCFWISLALWTPNPWLNNSRMSSSVIPFTSG